MNDPIIREAAYDKLAAHLGEMGDQRRAEHHSFRTLHHTGPDGKCVEDGQTPPCKTMQIVDHLEVTHGH